MSPFPITWICVPDSRGYMAKIYSRNEEELLSSLMTWKNSNTIRPNCLLKDKQKWICWTMVGQKQKEPPLGSSLLTH